MAKAPLLAAGRQGLVAVGLEEGVVAMYVPGHLHFDAYRDFTAFEAWIRPILSVAMLLAVAIQISRVRRRARGRHNAAAPEHSAISDRGQNSKLLRGPLARVSGLAQASGRLPTDAALPSDASISFGSDVTIPASRFRDHSGGSPIGGSRQESDDHDMEAEHAELTRLMGTASIRERAVRSHIMRDFR